MRSIMQLTIAVAMTVLSCSSCSSAASPGNAAAPPSRNPPELGRVNWSRDLDAALKSSGQSNKPILLLFQEIPGCQGCKDFGASPLTHPLLVEAIETEFIPIAIHNNKPGYDNQILQRFNEPAWNYPVIRFLNNDAKDLIPRQDGIFDVSGVATRMIDALQAAKREVPAYLKLAAIEADSTRHSRATFAMHCFWEGEAKVGMIEGVITTRAGFLENEEVVDVTFDPSVISYEQLVRAAQKVECAKYAYAHSSDQFTMAKAILGDRAKSPKPPGRVKPAPAADQQYALAHSGLKWLPLTPMQATKVNSWLGSNQDWTEWLSPRQRELVGRLQATLRRDANALDNLTRPDRIEELAAYTDQLLSRLDDASASSKSTGN
jgi:hypothetical protein